MMNLFKFLNRFGAGNQAAADRQAVPGAGHQGRGSSVHPDNYWRRLYTSMQFVDVELRATIQRIRYMDRVDPRVKKIHTRSARSAAKGGLTINTSSGNTQLIDHWKRFQHRLKLHLREKLESDLRGFLMEGNLPIQWVVDTELRQVINAIRMPSETMIPLVDTSGQFMDPAKAWKQVNPQTGEDLAHFALYQLTMARLTPDNFDDWGSFGRPYLDSARPIWDKLRMSEEDLVIRRRTRAPQRMHHNLPSYDQEQLEEYRDRVEEDQAEGNWVDYYTNAEKAGINPIAGDANLSEIEDVVHLLSGFSAGAPMDKALFGYTGNINRDILEDLKRDWFDELDSIQDLAAQVYEFGFRLDLLLHDIDPDQWDFTIGFAERHAETLNQRADRALKYQAIGVPKDMVWTAAGLDPAAVRKQREAEANMDDPYPDDDPGNSGGGGQPRVSITPSNQRKGESSTSVSN